jgi:hypothetical protein
VAVVIGKVGFGALTDAGCVNEKEDSEEAFEAGKDDGRGVPGFGIDRGISKKSPKGLDLGGKPPSIFFDSEPPETDSSKVRDHLNNRRS